MIYFEHSGYFYYCAAVPLFIAIWLFNRWRQSGIAASLGEKSLVRALMITSPVFIQILKLFLFVAVFLSLLAAMARPFSLEKRETKTIQGSSDIVFLVDVSKSMYVSDVAPDRLSRAKRLIGEIVGRLTNERVGIVLFAGGASNYIPLTNDYEYINKMVEGISGMLIERQGTSLGEALTISSLSFSMDTGRAKVLCLISDGEFHDKNGIGQADTLRRSGIDVFAFGFGTDSGKWVPGEPMITSRLHSNELLSIAGNNAGNYMNATDNGIAAAAFINRLSSIETGGTAVYPRQNFKICLMIALILSVIEIFLPASTRAKN